MKISKVLWLLSVTLVVILFTSPHGRAQLFKYDGEGGTKPGTHAPVITQYFAVDKGYYGYIWKIYVEADDPDGDMLRIASVVDQPGVGHYPTFWTVVRSQNQKHFKGYLQWNTFSARAPNMPEWTEITLKISVMDKAGNWSNEVVFPFTFETGVSNRYGSKPPSPFDQGDLPRLGYIGIELYSPTSLGDGGSERD
jgi:hypothetical protein